MAAPEVKAPKIKWESVDGATAATRVAYHFSDSAFIFPITPSTPLSEACEVWASDGRKNAFGQKMVVRQMQSEAGAAGALHGALTIGNLATTFTASQGLLLMIPNLFKIAGELLPCVMHVTARSIATHALSIFGDHQDIYSARMTGFAILGGCDVQEAQDIALISHLATLRSRVPFIHFQDGFRISHEVCKIRGLTDDDLNSVVDWKDVQRFRDMGLDPGRPTQKGTSQEPSVYFQAAEACNSYYDAVPKIVDEMMEKCKGILGKRYQLVEYVGKCKDPELVIVLMGSASYNVEELLEKLPADQKVGMIRVRLYRPWPTEYFLKALPASVKRIAVLDRTKEKGALGEPLFLDVTTTVHMAGRNIEVFGGRYGLSSKDFTPAMAIAVFENLRQPKPKHGFTVGINDDVTHLSLTVKPFPSTVPTGTSQCLFWGLGSDGTVGANRQAIRIVADNTDMYAQGYFQYDALKAGSMTISHLRFGPKLITSHYYITQDADFISCSQMSYVTRFDLVAALKDGGSFLLNTSCVTLPELEANLPGSLKKAIATKKAKFYVINAEKIATSVGLGGRFVNMVMQSAFFKISKVLPVEDSIRFLKGAVSKIYGKKGDKVIKVNHAAIDKAILPESLLEIAYPAAWANAQVEAMRKTNVPENKKTPFIKDVFDMVASNRGDEIPVSKFAPDGQIETGTAAFAKRGIALQLPHWNSQSCIQCNACAISCPHAVIRPYLMSKDDAGKGQNIPGFSTLESKDIEDGNFKIQISPLDCTGCGVCTTVCPSEGTLVMTPYDKEAPAARPQYDYVAGLPHRGHEVTKAKGSRGVGFKFPYLEFSGACAGCGETPYVRLLTQMYGDRMVVANATGCSSIWGGSFPYNPYTKHPGSNRGIAWHNSLFEDNAEFGYGMAVGYKLLKDWVGKAVETIKNSKVCGEDKEGKELQALFEEWWASKDDGEKSLVVFNKLRTALSQPALAQRIAQNVTLSTIRNNMLLLVQRSQWIVGGDGWAYDIDFGGLDHVLQMKDNINVFILNTEVYSNTGGQRSKATKRSAVAHFCAMGKDTAAKDLAMIAISYGDTYVAQIAIGADREHTIKAIKEAEEYNGPSLIIAYSPCLEHGMQPNGLTDSMTCQKLAVETGYWTLFRYNPALKASGQNPFSLDSRPPKKDPLLFLKTQTRFNVLPGKLGPAAAEAFQNSLREDLRMQRLKYERLKYELSMEWMEKKEEAAPAPAVAAPAPAAAASAPSRVMVLFCTQTGNSENAAKQTAEFGKKLGVATQVVCMGDTTPEKVAQEQMVLVCMSSTGVGDVPDNGVDFYTALVEAGKSKPALMKSTRFGIFGLGDKSYTTSYQGAPKKMEAAFKALGAVQIGSRGEGDEKVKGGYNVALQAWMPAIWAAVTGKAAPAPAAAAAASPAKPATPAAPAPAPAAAAPAAASPARAASGSVTQQPTSPANGAVTVAAVPVPTFKTVTTPNVQAPNFGPVAFHYNGPPKVKPGVLTAAQLNPDVDAAPGVHYVGAIDWNIREFHGYDTRHGSSYNAWLIMDEQPTLIDTVKYTVPEVLLENISAYMPLEKLAYVVANHAEPDHSGSLPAIVDSCPNVQVVCNAKCKQTLELIYDTKKWKWLIVSPKQPLKIGKRTLHFVDVPMVHWPESMMTYCPEEEILFSNDGFGQHYASVHHWDDQNPLDTIMGLAKEYYANILMCFNQPIARAFDKLKDVKIKRICTAHGISWRQSVSAILSAYQKWFNCVCEAKVSIIYDTMYDTTYEMAMAASKGIESTGVQFKLLSCRHVDTTAMVTEVMDSAGVIVGSSILNGLALPTVVRACSYIAGLSPSGSERLGFAFGSYGWQPGQVDIKVSELLADMKVKKIHDTIAVNYKPTEEVLKACWLAGRAVALAVIDKVKPQQK